MKDQKKLSIIVPIYNVERYVERCVNSILSCNLKNTEIILVDDGSTDNSGKIADSFQKNNKNVFVIHKENGGLSSARNSGIEKATGEYLIFIDSDDYVDENLCKVFDYLDGKTEIVCFGYIAHYINSEKNVFFSDKLEILSNAKSITDSICLCTKKNGAWLKAVKRQFLLENNLYFEDGFAEDFNWTGRMLVYAKDVTLTPIIYYHYILEREGSIMNVTKKQRFFDLINHSKSIYREIEKNEIEDKRSEKIKQYVGFNLLRNFVNLTKLEKKEREEVLSLVKDNKEMFEKQGSWKTKFFIKLAKLFGYKIMFNLAAKFIK